MALIGSFFLAKHSRLIGLFPSLIAWALCALPAVAMAAPDKVGSESAPGRPKIGLVLAGGGAKGAAHIGVLKVLEELRIPIDYVAGTSMGAVVGGLYATGMSAQDIEQEVQRIDWKDIFVDSPERQDLSFRRKTDDLLYIFKAKPGFKDGALQVPLGVIRGQKFDLELSRLTQQVADIHDFDRLPIPFRAVATDLETGKEVVLGSGNLSRAIRASLAVPGAFGPVEIDGRILVDGGLSNNVPVSVARAMGADVVIVSDLGSDLYTREDLTSGVAVGLQMVNFLFALNSQEQLNSLGDADALISVSLGDISPASFDRIAEAIPRGEQAARQAADSLRRYGLAGSDYAEYQRRQAKQKAGKPVIAFVRIENESSIGDDVIASYVTASAGSQLDIANLETQIQQIYGLDLFESVRYELVDEDGEQGLVIHVKEKPWGPAYVQAGLIASTNFAGDSAFRLGLAYTRTQINALNGEWRIAAEIGDEAGVFAEIFQPLDPSARYFGFGSIGLAADNYYVYDSAGNNTARYRSTAYSVELGAGRQFGTWGELRLGYLRLHGETEVSTGLPTPDYSFDIGELFVRMTDDKLDSVYFPTKGHAAVAEWRTAADWLGSDSDYQQARLDYAHAYSWGRNSLIGSVGLRTTFEDDAPIERAFRLGGFLQLSGFDRDRLTGQHAGLARVLFLHRVADAALAKTYLGASIEYGNVWQDSSDISPDDGILAGSLFLGVDLPIGPLYVGYGHNDASDGSVYLYLGPIFSF